MVNAPRFNFEFDLDELSLVFTVLITGIGTHIIIDGGTYLSKDKNLGSYYSFIFIFIGVPAPQSFLYISKFIVKAA